AERGGGVEIARDVSVPLRVNRDCVRLIKVVTARFARPNQISGRIVFGNKNIGLAASGEIGWTKTGRALEQPGDEHVARGVGCDAKPPVVRIPTSSAGQKKVPRSVVFYHKNVVQAATDEISRAKGISARKVACQKNISI